MKFVLERITDPDIEPVTLAEAKSHVRQFTSVTDDDAQITSLIKGGREWAEDFTGRALIEQSWRLSIDSGFLGGGDAVAGYKGPAWGCGVPGRYEWFGWLASEIRLHKSPVLAITKFVSVDAAGVEVAVDPATWQLRESKSKWPRMVALNGAVWPTGSISGGLRVEFRAGYADRLGSPQQGAEMVPSRFKQAIKLWLEANYDRDQMMMAKLLEAAESQIKPERVDLQIA